MLSIYYHEQYAPMRRQELEREAQQIRLAASVRPQGDPFQGLMNSLEGLLMKLGLLMRPEEQFRPRVKPFTGSL
ncbi:MAG TPA: hypothetical protein VFA09_05170 [Ktedonobacteraceae bacterium]|nr:hypothetical protein [Ktedonobacteraceae bacterium]